MNLQRITGILTALTSIIAVVLIIKQNFNWAIFCITFLFTITNFMRARDMRSKGYEKEAGLMRGLSIFFGIATVAVLLVNLFK